MLCTMASWRPRDPITKYILVLLYIDARSTCKAFDCKNNQIGWVLLKTLILFWIWYNSLSIFKHYLSRKLSSMFLRRLCFNLSFNIALSSEFSSFKGRSESRFGWLISVFLALDYLLSNPYALAIISLDCRATLSEISWFFEDKGLFEYLPSGISFACESFVWIKDEFVLKPILSKLSFEFGLLATKNRLHCIWFEANWINGFS